MSLSCQLFLKNTVFPYNILYFFIIFYKEIYRKNRCKSNFAEIQRFLFWLGQRDLNPRSDRVKVCCLTAWLCPIILDLQQKSPTNSNRASLSTWRRHPDLNWGSGCCRPTPYHLAIAPCWSGLRGSNSLPPPWQGGALPDELNPHGDPDEARTHDL